AMTYRQVPNILTVLRLVLAAVFFIVLNQYRYDSGRPEWLLVAAGVIFILAALTDAADGYLARRWHVESTFGRIMDPFCDKVLVIGAFIYLAGPRFVIPDRVPDSFFTMVSGVYPWMVAIILARELLVTAVRGEVETTGVAFGANLWGKLKMILQSIGIPVILLIVYLDPAAEGYRWLAWVRDVLVYAIVIVTALSVLPYLTQAARALNPPQAEELDRKTAAQQRSAKT
ncbi:MAG: CDP-diacylglycerol--glycerol-3-phosphate 3-phosphatidyltransferase, partial [bacterium]